MGLNEVWLPGAAVRLQERGPEWLDVIDDQPWSDQSGSLRGFFSTFRIRPDRDVWFHFPFPTPSATRLDQVSLLWETLEGAAVFWVCLHHGGMERIPLTERGGALPAVAVPFEPPDEWRHYYPPANRMLSEIPVEPAISARFGVQLCVLVRGPGIVRFYGAGARFDAA